MFAVNKLRALGLLVAVLFGTAVLANSDLRADVKFLQQQIAKDLRSGDFEQASEHVQRFRDLDVVMPPALVLIEAKLAARAQKLVPAYDLLQEYFSLTDDRGASYRSAQRLFEQIKPEAEVEKRRLEAEKTAEAWKQEAEELFVECALGDYTQACLRLAERHRFGSHGVERSKAAALRLYQLGCKRGSKEACAEAANM